MAEVEWMVWHSFRWHVPGNTSMMYFVLLLMMCHTQVNQVKLILLVDQKIGGMDISVKDMMTMQMINRMYQLTRNACFDFERNMTDFPGHGRSFDILKKKVGNSIMH